MRIQLSWKTRNGLQNFHKVQFCVPVEFLIFFVSAHSFGLSKPSDQSPLFLLASLSPLKTQVIRKSYSVS